MGQDPRAPHYSPDGMWWWDGATWRPTQPSSTPSGGMPPGAIVAVIAGAVAVVLITVAVLAYLGYRRLDESLKTSPVVAANAIPCDQLEHTQVHYHAALQILDAGRAVSIPTGVGRTRSCYYWLHMHDGEEGIIHIEAPSDRTFTLADFFEVWSSWAGAKELIDTRQVSTISLDSSQKLVVYVDIGSGPKAFTGDPATIHLEDREVVTLEISPPTVSPPPAFDWPPGF